MAQERKIGSSPSLTLLRVAVGSSNPAKVRAVRDALDKALQRYQGNVQIDIQSFPVSSGVPDQPMGDTDTRQGAINRAKAAFSEYVKKVQQEPHFAFGLEGGLEIEEGGNNSKYLWSMAWMAIYGRRCPRVLELFASDNCGGNSPVEETMTWGLGKTGAFLLPPAISHLVLNENMELGDADDKVFARIKSKHGSGTVGLLTGGLIDRKAYYDHALILALVPWVRPDVYPHGYQILE